MEMRGSSRAGNEQQIAANESKMGGGNTANYGEMEDSEADCQRFSLSVFSSVAGDKTRLISCI